MAQAIQPWTPSTAVSLQQRAIKSREILSSATSPQEAYKAAKQLVGCWPHAKPPDPQGYADGLAAVLAQYPLGLVQECVDPRTGLARSREFPPTVACVVEWCDKRLAYHQSVAEWKDPQRIDHKTARKAQTGIMVAIRGILHTLKGGGDVKALTLDEAMQRGTDQAA
jgi:hypothetical protein